jgi:hypothetical protein
MDDLVQWLRDRLDEDEQATRAAALTEGLTGSLVDFLKHESMQVDVAPSEAHYARHTPARVLREIDAKRKRLAALAEAIAAGHDSSDLASELLPLEALPYVDRPGYREEWRP